MPASQHLNGEAAITPASQPPDAPEVVIMTIPGAPSDHKAVQVRPKLHVLGIFLTFNDPIYHGYIISITGKLNHIMVNTMKSTWLKHYDINNVNGVET